MAIDDRIGKESVCVGGGGEKRGDIFSCISYFRIYVMKKHSYNSTIMLFISRNVIELKLIYLKFK